MRIFLLLLAATAAAQQPPQLPATPEPAISADHTVTFRLTAPAATTVALALENSGAPLPMQRGESGTWTVTTPPLASEFYSYHFVVDGRNQLDILNPKMAESYTAAGNTFLVPGPDLATTTASLAASGPGPWEHTAVPHGVVHHHDFTTRVAVGLPGSQSTFYVYTPPGYDARANTKYPVLYLLHGWSDTAAGWTNIGHANDILDNLIAQGKAKPMIVVMPLGYGDISFLRKGFGVWNDPAAIDHNTALFTQTLLTEVRPMVEKLYNVSLKREDRAITGLSMGGLEALTIGLTHPDDFAWVGGFSAAVHQVQPTTFAALDPKTARLKLVYIGCGTADGLIEPNRRLAASLRAQGQAVTTSEMPGIAHVWLEWRPDLVSFASRIFQP